MQNRLVRNLVIGVGAAFAATQAQATLMLNTSILPGIGGDAYTDTNGNDLPNHPTNVYFGQLQATTDGTVEFFYVGNEAGYTNSLYIGGALARSEGPDGFGSPYPSDGTLGVSTGELLDFGFCTSGGVSLVTYGRCADNDNSASLLAQFNYYGLGSGYRSIGFAALSSFDPNGGWTFAGSEAGPQSNLWMILWDDSGADNDDNHDDFVTVARFTPTSVPEPGALLLLGTGLIAAGFVRRRRIGS
jgi:hypothetical protein